MCAFCYLQDLKDHYSRQSDQKQEEKKINELKKLVRKEMLRSFYQSKIRMKMGRREHKELTYK